MANPVTVLAQETLIASTGGTVNYRESFQEVIDDRTLVKTYDLHQFRFLLAGAVGDWVADNAAAILNDAGTLSDDLPDLDRVFANDRFVQVTMHDANDRNYLGVSMQNRTQNVSSPSIVVWVADPGGDDDLTEAIAAARELADKIRARIIGSAVSATIEQRVESLEDRVTALEA